MKIGVNSFVIVSLLLISQCEGWKKDASATASYSIGSALRYLSKGIFTAALAPGHTGTSVDEYLGLANVQDSGDCVKRLICEVQGLVHSGQLLWDEQLIASIIPSDIDYESPIIQLELAANLGRNNPKQCSNVYSRCSFDREQIMTLMRQRGTSMDIKSGNDYDCTVLFLWNKKFNEEDFKKDKEEQEKDDAGDGQ